MKVNNDSKLDTVHSIDTSDGIIWAYIKDNKIVDQVFWDWQRLYKSVISK